MTPFQQLEQRVRILEKQLADLQRGDKHTIGTDIYVSNGRNFHFSTATGTQIGSGTTEKLAFWGATPVAQQAAITSTGGGGTDSDGTARTAIDSILIRLRKVGIIAS